MTGLSTITARVTRGAALLDERQPGWAGRISLGALDIGSPCCCILGQLYGSYGRGLRELDWGDRGGEYGFMWEADELDDPDAAYCEIDALDAAWRELIEARRAACVRCRASEVPLRRLEHEPGFVCENSGACGRRRQALAAKAGAR